MSKKHAKDGGSSQSPKYRHRMKSEAERNERKPNPSTCKYKSIDELMRGS